MGRRALTMPLLLMLLAAPVGGCSFAFSRSVSSDWTPDRPPDCKPTVLPPLVDTAIAVVMLAVSGALWLRASSCRESGECSGDRTPSYGYGAVAGVFGVSAGVGYRLSFDCSEAHVEHQERTTGKAGH